MEDLPCFRANGMLAGNPAHRKEHAVQCSAPRPHCSLVMLSLLAACMSCNRHCPLHGPLDSTPLGRVVALAHKRDALHLGPPGDCSSLLLLYAIASLDLTSASISVTAELVLT